MKKTRFLISSLVAAGIAPAQFAQAAIDGGPRISGGPDPDGAAMVQRFAQEHRFSLAQHRSHSSHSSHSSHRSGSSGRTRAPVYTPPAPRIPRVTPTPAPAPSPTRNQRSNPSSSILPASPATAPQSFYSAPSESTSEAPAPSEIEMIVRKVQIGLMAYGYYDGIADGMVGPKTRSALTRFQTDFGLKVTGTVTPEVLDAFKIVAQ
ncbi:peptidoglycan-binding protein [Novosphingopyxis sp.]|uniref:peptidoglycan-binding protein n=1 Tax=Novosphingopyxis sp. TaxID=2709690 RepID=UPI003B5A438C